MTQLMDMWDRSILNLYASPLRQREYVTGAIIFSLARVAIGTVLLSVFVGVAFDFNILDVGAVLVPAFVLLVMFGWALGLHDPRVRAAVRVERRGARVVARAAAAAGVRGLLSGELLPGWLQADRQGDARVVRVRGAAGVPRRRRGARGQPRSSRASLDVVYLAVGCTRARGRRTGACGRGAC